MAWWRRESRRQSEPSALDPNAPLIRLEGVTRHFPGEDGEPSVALQDVTVDIHGGEFVSVSGPSGCGKSTFLSIIGLLDTPTSGRYYLKGRPTDRLHAQRARANAKRRHRAGVPELQSDWRSHGLRERRVSVDDQGREPRRTPASRDGRARARRSVLRAHRSARRRLSGGHQQLVAIARAIAGQPPIVLADEPTGNLDSAAGEVVMQTIRELHASGSTICLATHNPHYIAMAERHIKLFDGRVVGS